MFYAVRLQKGSSHTTGSSGKVATREGRNPSTRTSRAGSEIGPLYKRQESVVVNS